MLNGMHITLPRTKLIEIVTEQKAKLQLAYDAQIDELKLAIDDLVSVPEALLEWHTDIAAGLASGIYSVKADGTYHAGSGNDEPPEKPSLARRGATKKHLLATIKNSERQAAHWAAQFDTALTLLSYATNVDLDVPVNDYEYLLSRRPEAWNY